MAGEPGPRRGGRRPRGATEPGGDPHDRGRRLPVDRTGVFVAPVAHVELTVTGGGAERSWHGWRRDGTPNGIDVGNFPTAEAAMTAVDAAG